MPFVRFTRSTHLPSESRRKSFRILCAEDHEQLALLLKAGLERAGHCVECVADGQKALERIAADLKHFDVLITDHQMPRLSGLGLVEKLRAAAFPGKIVVHSSKLVFADAAAYRALVVDGIFDKPAEFNRLLGSIQQWAQAK